MATLGILGWAALAAMTAQAPFFLDREETELERARRLQPVAYAQEQACLAIWPQEPRSCVRGLLLIGERETHWARYVGEGRCKDGPVGMRCDPDRFGNPRARTYWQLWPAACPKLKHTVPGSEAELMLGARCAAAQLRTAYARCSSNPHGRWAGAFAGYRSIDCHWPGGARRAALLGTIENQMRISPDKIKLALIGAED